MLGVKDNWNVGFKVTGQSALVNASYDAHGNHLSDHSGGFSRVTFHVTLTTVLFSWSR